MTVLVLCHGNICRSPLAAAIMAKEGFEDTATAGFKPDDALKVPKKVRDWAQENLEIDLKGHSSRQVTADMLKSAELILYMDSGQRRRLENIWESAGLTEDRGPLNNFCEPLGRYLNEPQEKIGDPMFAGNKDDPRFLKIMHQLVEASKNFVKARSESPIMTDVA